MGSIKATKREWVIVFFFSAMGGILGVVFGLLFSKNIAGALALMWVATVSGVIFGFKIAEDDRNEL